MTQARLKKYIGKRDFTKTAEPSGGGRSVIRGHRYLIQKHAASHLHYDFRLQHDGVLLSWAIPKGPSLDPADKRLAVHVEDHPVAYGDFEGTIPKGQYGGGTVMLWDVGQWAPLGDVAEGLAAGNLKFAVLGERLKGGFALVRLKARGNTRDKRYGDGRDNWLLIKEKDPYARPGGTPPTERFMRSVKSGRTMEEIARGDSVWHSNQPDGRAPAPKVVKAPAKKAAKSAARKAVGKTAAKRKAPGRTRAKSATKKTTRRAR